MGHVHVEFPYVLTGSFLADAADSLAPSRVLIGAWLLLSAAQWLTAADVFSEGGPLPWAMLSRVRRPSLVSRLRRRMSPRALQVLLAMQLCGSVVLISIPSVPVLLVCLAFLIAIVGGSIVLTGEFWSDGSDKMGMIVMVGTSLVAAGVLLADPALALAGVLIAGGQLTISYLAAGLSKIFIADWRSGAELAGIMATESWGHPLAGRLMRHRPIALAATWSVILAEALFPLALLAPRPVLVAALGALLLFHVATAVLMGLNRFPWIFAAAYPSALLLGRVVRAALGWDG